MISRILPRILIPAAVFALAGCSGDSDPGPGGVTRGEARQLDAAAAMLDARPAAPLVDATVPADIGEDTSKGQRTKGRGHT
ncbi:hypothetical protein Y88_2984 [Novosphingobium nitrogenifigens DSM 19370]|uniref:Lipoprotein n=1 Tax=Novosphingobium nitrogenifigens DSM 19370 TaxID=983920 RepID=F1ZCK5_9SPHN|nr:hypothetical protein [Novosphingobium nitrogenifigens]EGD57658.1 hypothetical protein Y88_2984 [Novosphingobium nitrogenifigens DSM 19370]